MRIRTLATSTAAVIMTCAALGTLAACDDAPPGGQGAAPPTAPTDAGDGAGGTVAGSDRGVPSQAGSGGQDTVETTTRLTAPVGPGRLEVTSDGTPSARVTVGGSAGPALRMTLPPTGTKHLVCAASTNDLCALVSRTGTQRASLQVLRVDLTKRTVALSRTEQVLPVVGVFGEKGAVGLVNAIRPATGRTVLQVVSVTPTRTQVLGCVTPQLDDPMSLQQAMPRTFTGLARC